MNLTTKLNLYQFFVHMIYCSRLITKMDILKPLQYVLIDVSAQTFCLKNLVGY